MRARRGRLGRTHLEHPADVRPELRAGRLRSPARVPDGLRLCAAVHAGPHGPVGLLLQGWQVNGIVAAFSGTPYSIGGTNTALNCQGCGNGDFITIDYGDPEPTGSWAATGEPYYPVANFSQPTGADIAGFGNTRPQLLPPSAGLERRPVGVQGVPDRPLAAGDPARDGQRLQPHELGSAGDGVHGEQLHAVRAAEHGRHDNNNQLNTPGPRRIQIGLRTSF